MEVVIPPKLVKRILDLEFIEMNEHGELKPYSCAVRVPIGHHVEPQ